MFELYCQPKLLVLRVYVEMILNPKQLFAIVSIYFNQWDEKEEDKDPEMNLTDLKLLFFHHVFFLSWTLITYLHTIAKLTQ